MSLFSVLIGHLLNQIDAKDVDGAEAGLKYFVEVGQIEIWAYETNNTAAQDDVNAIRKQWISETKAEGGQISEQVVTWLQGAIIGNPPKEDPWATSRAMTQALWTKWAAAAGLAPTT